MDPKIDHKEIELHLVNLMSKVPIKYPITITIHINSNPVPIAKSNKIHDPKLDYHAIIQINPESKITIKFWRKKEILGMASIEAKPYFLSLNTKPHKLTHQITFEKMVKGKVVSLINVGKINIVINVKTINDDDDDSDIDVKKPNFKISMNPIAMPSSSMSLADIISESESILPQTATHSSNCVQLASECIEMGDQINQTLSKNHTQLSNAISNQDQITADLKECKREVKSIHSIGGQMKNAFTKSTHEKDKAKIAKKQPLLPPGHSSVSVREAPNTSKDIIDLSQLSHLSDQSIHTQQAINDHVNQLAQSVGVIKEQAVVMNHSLNGQVVMLDTLGSKTDQNAANLKAVRGKVRREF